MPELIETKPFQHEMREHQKNTTWVLTGYKWPSHLKEKETNDWNGQKFYTKKRKERLEFRSQKVKKKSFPSKKEMKHTLSLYKGPSSVFVYIGFLS